MNIKLGTIFLPSLFVDSIYAQMAAGNVAVGIFQNIPLFELVSPLTQNQMPPKTLATVNIQGLTGQEAPPVIFMSTTPFPNALAVPLLPIEKPKGKGEPKKDK